MSVNGSTPDTSVVVAGLSAWHPDHESARRVLAGHPVVIAHVLAESYAVLTRLPGNRSLPLDAVAAALADAFPADSVGHPPEAVRALLRRLVSAGIGGGRTYDAIVADTARRHGLGLTTLDRRASSTYEVVGVDVTFLE